MSVKWVGRAIAALAVLACGAAAAVTGAWYDDDVTVDYGTDQDWSIAHDSTTENLTVYEGSTEIVEVSTGGDLTIAGRLTQEGLSGGVSSDNLVAYWKMDTATGSLVDYSGNGYDGTQGGTGTAITTGRIGNALSYDGSGYTSVGQGLNAYAATSITLSLWYKSSSTGYDSMFGLTKASPLKVLRIQRVTTRTRFYIGDGDDIVSVDGTTTISDSAWHHIVAVRDETTSTAYLYVDGVLDASEDITDIDDCAHATDWCIQARGDTLAASDAASLDEIAVWNRALTADEVEALYLSTSEIVDTYGAVLLSGVTLNSGKISSTGATVWTPVTITADDTTPTVGSGNVLTIPGTWTAGNDVTDLDDGTAGQVVVVLGGDDDCDFADGSNLHLNGDFTAAADSALVLAQSGTTWYEVARNVPDTQTYRIWLSPEDSPAGGTLYTAATNGIAVSSHAFPDPGPSYRYWSFVLPEDYVAGSNVTVRFLSMCAAATPAGDAEWTLTSVVCGDSDALDTAYGNSVAFTQTYDTQKDVEIYEGSDKAVFGASASPGDFVALKVSRDPSAANDTLGEIAYLLGIELTW